MTYISDDGRELIELTMKKYRESKEQENQIKAAMTKMGHAGWKNGKKNLFPLWDDPSSCGFSKVAYLQKTDVHGTIRCIGCWKNSTGHLYWTTSMFSTAPNDQPFRETVRADLNKMRTTADGNFMEAVRWTGAEKQDRLAFYARCQKAKANRSTDYSKKTTKLIREILDA
jgi:hypothetical protein